MSISQANTKKDKPVTHITPHRLAKLQWSGSSLKICGDFLEQNHLESKIKSLQAVLGNESKTEIAVLILARNLIKRCRFNEAKDLILRHFDRHGPTESLSAELEKITRCD